MAGSGNPVHETASLVVGDRSTKVSVGPSPTTRQIFHAELKIGCGHQQTARGTVISHGFSGVISDLHQAIIAGMNDVRPITAFQDNYGIADLAWNAVRLRITHDHGFELCMVGRVTGRNGCAGKAGDMERTSDDEDGKSHKFDPFGKATLKRLS